MKSDLKISSIDKYLRNTNYIPDNEVLVTIFLALKLNKPLLVEGPPGTGKTDLSKAIAQAFNWDFFRVQCYEGITFEQIVGEWNYQKQLLQLEMTRKGEKIQDVFTDKFFIKRPLLSAFINGRPSVILIDELDKADEEVESFLLQALGEKQITVNDLGTFDLENELLVIITSNSQRILLDETKDRCLYLYLDYPSLEREVEIVKSHIPEASVDLITKVVTLIHQIRELDLLKKPSIRASVDWVRSLLALEKPDLEADSTRKTLGVILKNQEDQKKVLNKIFK